METLASTEGKPTWKVRSTLNDQPFGWSRLISKARPYTNQPHAMTKMSCNTKPFEPCKGNLCVKTNVPKDTHLPCTSRGLSGISMSKNVTVPATTRSHMKTTYPSKTSQPMRTLHAKTTLPSKTSQLRRTLHAKTTLPSKTSQPMRTLHTKTTVPSKISQPTKNVHAKTTLPSKTSQPMKNLHPKTTLPSKTGQTMRTLHAKSTVPLKTSQPMKSLHAKTALASKASQPMATLHTKTTIPSKTSQPMTSLHTKTAVPSKTNQPMKSLHANTTFPSKTSQPSQVTPSLNRTTKSSLSTTPSLPRVCSETFTVVKDDRSAGMLCSGKKVGWSPGTTKLKVWLTATNGDKRQQRLVLTHLLSLHPYITYLKKLLTLYMHVLTVWWCLFRTSSFFLSQEL